METEREEEVPDINSDVPLPSVREIREFRKQFEKNLKWRKNYRKEQINPFQLQQDARILREMQEIMSMKTDLHFTGLILDRRHNQSAAVNVKAAAMDPPIETENKKPTPRNSYYSFKSNNYQSSFYDSSDSDESYKPRSSKHVKLQMPGSNLKIRRTLSPIKESFFQPTPNYKTRSYRY